MEKRILYHTGFQEVRRPDVRSGRKNADFGQGFYLSSDRDFALRWAKRRRGFQTWLNAYELDLDGLNILRFARDAAWYDYIAANRAGAEDGLRVYDVMIGPIANDMLYETWGIHTSGLMDRVQALSLLSLGPAYEQTAIKTERAAARLRFLSARVIGAEEIERYRAVAAEETERYQRLLADALVKMPGFDA